MSDEDEPVETKKYNVQVIVSSLGNERRTISFNDVEQDQVKTIIQTAEAAFATLRTNESLLLTGSDGQIVLVNTKNVVFIEVRVG